MYRLGEFVVFFIAMVMLGIATRLVIKSWVG